MSAMGMADVESDGGPSHEGRRVLVALVTGPAASVIQAWRARHDSEQARRIPPHATLCYRIPVVEPSVLEPQVRHAFDRPIPVRLGPVREFGNTDRTLYVAVEETAELDAARARLFDGTHVRLADRTDWMWHVTCVRYGRTRPSAALEALRREAHDLVLGRSWVVDTIAVLELRQQVYRPLATWIVDDHASHA